MSQIKLRPWEQDLERRAELAQKFALAKDRNELDQSKRCIKALRYANSNWSEVNLKLRHDLKRAKRALGGTVILVALMTAAALIGWLVVILR